MKVAFPAGTRPHAVVGRKCLMRRTWAMQAGIIPFTFFVLLAAPVQGEPRVLWHVNFDVSLIPEVRPLRSHHILQLPVVLEEPGEPFRAEGSAPATIARELLETGKTGVGRAVLGRVTPAHLLPKPVLKAPQLKAKNEAFGLVKKMPQAYAGMMFGVGWLLLLISVGLGYLGRKIEPYSEDDPASWNEDVRRPLAPLLIDADEMRAASAYPDRRL